MSPDTQLRPIIWEVLPLLNKATNKASVNISFGAFYYIITFKGYFTVFKAFRLFDPHLLMI